MNAPRWSEIPVPPDYIGNGCTCSPDVLMGVGDIRAACHVHDWLYHLGGDEDARRFADRKLYEGIREIGGGGIWATYLANYYWCSVRLFGGRFFRYK